MPPASRQRHFNVRYYFFTVFLLLLAVLPPLLLEVVVSLLLDTTFSFLSAELDVRLFADVLYFFVRSVSCFAFLFEDRLLLLLLDDACWLSLTDCDCEVPVLAAAFLEVVPQAVIAEVSSAVAMNRAAILRPFCVCNIKKILSDIEVQVLSNLSDDSLQ